ncbi:proteasome assembly chaperone 4 [Babesia bovis T2Bo]|uniref:Proteasome assembly chaperone 4 n=1 Tax=Babesia bovis TaxID=5865 RepID=A7AV62_BABBO|nr:proteasome assembly chaperone 4 [Babesia bovis T2Bo]EDO05688.1 proteasome assembly chaperone 4 [Babesia bovis T2Bo]|eukprot:XP_001609256.1 hypothetical protein [Babesia bovis T2Bo]
MEVHKASFSVYDKTLNVMSVELKSGVYIWVGDESLTFQDLHCGFPNTTIQGEDTLGTTLIGDLDAISSDISKALAKKLNIPVFLSLNYDETDCTVQSVLQQELMDTIINMYPQYVKT